jgi:DNA-binding NarL/FixJ family response regulator
MLALEAFKRLGSGPYVESTSRFLASLSGGRLNVSKQASDLYHLTSRESDVLGRIAAGMTNQEIADDLVLSVRTVERHISTIYGKLHLQGSAARASAAAIAVSLEHDT